MTTLKLMYQVIIDDAYVDGRSSKNRKLDIIRVMVNYDVELIKVVITYMLDDVKSDSIKIIGGYHTPLGDEETLKHYLKDYIDTHFSVKVRLIKFEKIEGDKNEK